ncbi:glycerate kinase [Devosia sp. 63-57]|mgnify:FL=1|uniref:glycerate kinase type-2 family protein n=1 Tax=Devosia sp. 63-57 TaxID=1895751 RepID=UPI0008685E65|nr:glycerate kinase [Devosia sp. 63-57]ODT48132.1 MAG: hydroxypyruvate reductase [Pelagibacterium sp. SCN 63-126]ODU85416.1 MAG: hydroxypyruvate reductase [Pelagibacterium sp. SCN 63-17]OJX42159.1 MAG: glycerate kinase [Devosia sp. 63-57]
MMDRAPLHKLFVEAVAKAQPALAVERHLPEPPMGRTIVIGAGKASAQMARAFEQAWPGAIEGLIVTRYGYGEACQRIEVVEAAHPVPDAAGCAAAERLKALVSGLTEDDLVVALISGGGSSLLPAPARGLTLEDEQAVNRALLASGAPIGVMNLIRNQFSTIKGGRLAALAAPARVVTLVVSDVPGDDPALVASGPTLPLRGGRAEARRLAALYGLELPEAAARLLASEENLPPEASDPVFARNSVATIASAALSLEAAAAMARAHGVEAAILSDAIEGEARDVAQVHAAIAREIVQRNRPFPRPVVLLSGGETTVTLRGSGRGGRNGEFLLALAIALDGVEGVTALAGDTDGIDGSEDNAGAYVDGTSAQRLREAGIDPLAALADNDAYGAFEAIGDLLMTGPTGTNVNDFRAILIR